MIEQTFFCARLRAEKISSFCAEKEKRNYQKKRRELHEEGRRRTISCMYLCEEERATEFGTEAAQVAASLTRSGCFFVLFFFLAVRALKNMTPNKGGQTETWKTLDVIMKMYEEANKISLHDHHRAGDVSEKLQ